MNRPESLRDIVPTLIRSGLPAEYAERAAAEFADHHRDLVDELVTTGWSESQAEAEALRRLGDSRTLTKNTIRSYQRRHFCGRWPIITFILGPIPTLLAIWGATGLLLYGIGLLAEKTGSRAPVELETIPFWDWMIMISVIAWFFFVAPAIVIFKLARMSNRAAVGWKLVAISACLLGLVVGFIDVRLPSRELRTIIVDGVMTQSDRPAFLVSVPMGIPAWRYLWRYYTHDTLHICRTLLPLAVVAGLSLFAKRQSLSAQRRLADAS